MIALLAPAFATEGALAWRGDVARVEIAVPAGLHVAPEAPAHLEIGRFIADLRGDPSALRFPIEPGPVRALVSLSLCEDGGSACHVVTLEGSGEVAGRKGHIDLDEPTPVAAPAAPPGAPVALLDFYGVWCPPCNLMSAEVLHDPADAEALSPYRVQAVDVDRPDAWNLKARYAVGGYPTLIAVDAQGAEVARLVGYPGESATLAWIAALATVTPLHRLDVEPSLTGAEASSAARRFAEAEKPDRARAYLARGSDGVDLRVARLMLDGKTEDAAWLVEHAPPGEWVLEALSAAPELWPRIAPLLPALPAATAADALSLAADGMADADAARLARAAAIVLLLGTFTGDPEHDRGHVVFLADLYDEIGRADEALALLDRYAGLYPAEFTFDFAAARHHVDHEAWGSAEARARDALRKAWGDQKLRAVQPLARALAGQGRKPEALAVLDEALAATERPPADLAVRTHRYLRQVDELRAELAR